MNGPPFCWDGHQINGKGEESCDFPVFFLVRGTGNSHDFLGFLDGEGGKHFVLVAGSKIFDFTIMQVPRGVPVCC